MDTASGGYNVFTVTYDSTTMKITISASNVFTLRCSENFFPYHELGFTTTNTSSATSHTSTNIISLERPQQLILSIHEFDEPLYVGNNTTIPHTFVIPLTANFGGKLH